MMNKIISYLYRFLSIFKHLFLVNTDVRINVKTGKYVKIYSKCILVDCMIGDYSYISYNSNIKHTRIGKFCSIGQNCIIGPGIHPTEFVTTSPCMYSTLRQCGKTFTDISLFKESEEVIIGNDVFIGANVIVMPGINIGDGAIIGAGAIVTKNVPPYAIVGGVPAKILKYRFECDIIEKFLKLKWWDKTEDELKRIPSVVNDLDSFFKIFESK